MVLACPKSSLPMMLKLGVCDGASFLLYVCLDGRRVPEVLLASFPKGPCCFPYVLLIAGYVVALVLVLESRVLSFNVQFVMILLNVLSFLVS